MPLVEIFAFNIERYYKRNVPIEHIIMDLSVIRKKRPKTTRYVMNLITKWSEDLRNRIPRKKFTECLKDESPQDSLRLMHLRYLFDELARKKYRLATIPENTYYMKSKYKDSEIPVDIYVDQGSPFRHLYWAKMTHYEINAPVGSRYTIWGLGREGGHYFTIWIDFFRPIDFEVGYLSKEEIRYAYSSQFYTKIALQASRNIWIQLLEQVLKAQNNEKTTI